MEISVKERMQVMHVIDAMPMLAIFQWRGISIARLNRGWALYRLEDGPAVVFTRKTHTALHAALRLARGQSASDPIAQAEHDVMMHRLCQRRTATTDQTEPPRKQNPLDRDSRRWRKIAKGSTS